MSKVPWEHISGSNSWILGGVQLCKKSPQTQQCSTSLLVSSWFLWIKNLEERVHGWSLLCNIYFLIWKDVEVGLMRHWDPPKPPSLPTQALKAPVSQSGLQQRLLPGRSICPFWLHRFSPSCLETALIIHDLALGVHFHCALLVNMTVNNISLQ